MNQLNLTHGERGGGVEPVARPQAYPDSIGSGSPSHLSFLLFGLLVQCPCGRRLESCPLCRFHPIECLEEKFFLAAQWSESELEQLLADHNQCYWHRVRPAIPEGYAASTARRTR